MASRIQGVKNFSISFSGAWGHRAGFGTYARSHGRQGANWTKHDYTINCRGWGEGGAMAKCRRSARPLCPCGASPPRGETGGRPRGAPLRRRGRGSYFRRNDGCALARAIPHSRAIARRPPHTCGEGPEHPFCPCGASPLGGRQGGHPRGAPLRRRGRGSCFRRNDGCALARAIPHPRAAARDLPTPVERWDGFPPSRE